MNPKKYKIKTIQDMIDCTNESNLDSFLKDLKALLITAHTFRGMVKLIGKKEGLSKEMQEIKSKGYTWIDDGKHEIETKIE